MKDRKQKKSGERFIRIPHWVMLLPEYRSLSYASRALLDDIVMQFNGRNNGSLVMCEKAMRPLGWNSSATITKCKRELIANGLLVETRKGAKPNRAAWFALRWLSLDVKEGQDINPLKYRTLAQMLVNAGPPKTGVEVTKIAPVSGVRPPITTPETGAMLPKIAASSTPLSGEYIEVAIPEVLEGESVDG
jgi:hypothetical protein